METPISILPTTDPPIDPTPEGILVQSCQPRPWHFPGPPTRAGRARWDSPLSRCDVAMKSGDLVMVITEHHSWEIIIMGIYQPL